MSNFHFIERFQPELADLGRCAERYVYSDPQSAIIKLRCFSEIYVGYIYQEYSLPSDGAEKFFDKLENAAFKNAVEKCVIDKLHAIRLKGNNAAHAKGVSVDEALWLIKEAYFLAAWLYVACHGGEVREILAYTEPQTVKAEEEILKKNNASLETKLNLQTVDLEKAKKELAESEARISEAQQHIDALNEVVDQSRLSALAENSIKMLAQFDLESEETRKRISIQDVFTEYQLTNGQAELVDELDEFLSGQDDNLFLLKGYAGTGKTFITKGLTEYFKSIGRNFVLCAPTGKASKVISSKTQCEAYTIHKTIYSFSDVKEYIDDNLFGTETYKFYASLAVNILSADTVYIVDEASMISDVYNESEFFRCGSGHLLRDFIKYVNLDHNDHRKKIIFIGDDAQLPPVGMSLSPALNPAYLAKEYRLHPRIFELTEVVRQKASSGVMHNAIKLRTALKEKVFNQLNFNMSFPDLEDVEYPSVIDRYMESCNREINAESIIIAHSNTDVAAYNKRIREEFFPGFMEVCPKDKVLAISNSDKYGFFISNGDFGLIRKVYGEAEKRSIKLRRKSAETDEVEEIVVPLQFRNVEVGFRDLEGIVHFFDAKIIENLLYSDAPTLSSDENKALYVDFCTRNRNLRRGSLEFKQALRSDPYFNALRLKFGYAITCHKAQGSEWNHVFVKCRTHQNQLTASYFRWFYTAITRTTNKLYLMERPNKPLGGGIIRVGNPGIQVNHPNPMTAGQLEPDQHPINQQAEVGDHTHVTVAIENFGIPQTAGILLCLLEQVRTKISQTEIQISNIYHNQFQEAYIFQKDDQIERVNFTYNNHHLVSSVLTQHMTEFSQTLLTLFKPLQGMLLATGEHSASEATFNFQKPFLEQFHQKLSENCSERNIRISNLEPREWCQRYYFEKDNGSAVIDIFYNGKYQFSRYEPVANRGSCPRLLAEMDQVITREFD